MLFHPPTPYIQGWNKYHVNHAQLDLPAHKDIPPPHCVCSYSLTLCEAPTCQTANTNCLQELGTRKMQLLFSSNYSCAPTESQNYTKSISQSWLKCYLRKQQHHSEDKGYTDLRISFSKETGAFWGIFGKVALLMKNWFFLHVHNRVQGLWKEQLFRCYRTLSDSPAGGSGKAAYSAWAFL